MANDGNNVDKRSIAEEIIKVIESGHLDYACTSA